MKKWIDDDCSAQTWSAESSFENTKIVKLPWRKTNSIGTTSMTNKTKNRQILHKKELAESNDKAMMHHPFSERYSQFYPKSSLSTLSHIYIHISQLHLPFLLLCVHKEATIKNGAKYDSQFNAFYVKLNQKWYFMCLIEKQAKVFCAHKIQIAKIKKTKMKTIKHYLHHSLKTKCPWQTVPEIEFSSQTQCVLSSLQVELA